MTSSHLIFLLIAAITLGSAYMVVSVRKLMHAALWLVMALFGVAMIFAMLEAGFFAVVQVVVYIGAIAILIIFAVMLTRRLMEDTGPQVNKNWGWAAAAGVGIFAAMVGGLSAWSGFAKASQALSKEGADVANLGKALTTPDGFALVFEVTSVLLLAALIGAIYVAMERKGGEE
jgi:NADH-quinone oxidoreductase subunit J